MIEYHNTKVVFIYAKIMQNQLVVLVTIGDIKDIRLLNQLEGRERHSKSHNKLCNCGVNHIIIMNYITEINTHYADKDLKGSI